MRRRESIYFHISHIIYRHADIMSAVNKSYI